jgi:hypothetical protein
LAIRYFPPPSHTGPTGFDHDVDTVMILLVDLTKLPLPGKRHWNVADVPELTVTVKFTMPPSEVVPV